MKFENVEFWNLIFSRTKRAFEVKQKTFFLVWQVLSFRLKKQTSTNVADTTFNIVLLHVSCDETDLHSISNIYSFIRICTDPYHISYFISFHFSPFCRFARVSSLKVRNMIDSETEIHNTRLLIRTLNDFLNILV